MVVQLGTKSVYPERDVGAEFCSLSPLMCPRMQMPFPLKRASFFLCVFRGGGAFSPESEIYTNSGLGWNYCTLLSFC